MPTPRASKPLNPTQRIRQMEQDGEWDELRRMALSPKALDALCAPAARAIGDVMARSKPRASA